MMLVDEATEEVKWEVKAHSQSGHHFGPQVAMSPDGMFVASGGFRDEHWRLWNVESGGSHRVGDRHGTGACICYLHLDQRELQGGCPVMAHTGQGICSVEFSSCGGMLATGGFDGAVIVWDVQTRSSQQRMMDEDPKMVSALSFSADGARLAAGDGGGSICLWATTTGSLLFRMRAGHLGVKSLHLSPSNNNLLASVTGQDVAVWDIEKGEESGRKLPAGGFAVFAPDGRMIATPGGIYEWDVHLFNAESGELLLTLVGHQNFVFSASFSGSQIASSSADGTCKVWDSSTGALLRTIVVGKPVFSVASGRDWVRDTQRAMAFAMGHHPRLGAGSQVLELDWGVVRMILDRV